jgi:cytochrome bd-type quinol oxidase subunit 2
MMLTLGVAFTALAILFGLTGLALWADGRVSHPIRILFALAAVLLVGLALLME